MGFLAESCVSVAVAIRRKNIVRVGESILSRIEEDLNIHIIGHGCRFVDAQNSTWSERLFTLLFAVFAERSGGQ